MREILTREQIYERYPDHWILLNEPFHDEYGKVAGGELIIADPDRETVYNKGFDIPPPRRLASLCTKKPPANMVFVL